MYPFFFKVLNLTSLVKSLGVNHGFLNDKRKKHLLDYEFKTNI